MSSTASGYDVGILRGPTDRAGMDNETDRWSPSVPSNVGVAESGLLRQTAKQGDT